MSETVDLFRGSEGLFIGFDLREFESTPSQPLRKAGIPSGFFRTEGRPIRLMRLKPQR